MNNLDFRISFIDINGRFACKFEHADPKSEYGALCYPILWLRLGEADPIAVPRGNKPFSLLGDSSLECGDLFA